MYTVICVKVDVIIKLSISVMGWTLTVPQWTLNGPAMDLQWIVENVYSFFVDASPGYITIAVKCHNIMLPCYLSN